MPTPTDDPFYRLTILAFMRASPGKEAGLKAEREALIEPTGQKDGYLQQGMKDPSTSLCQENWESAAQFDAHLETGHLVRFAGMIRDLLDENGLRRLRLQWIA